MPDTQYDILVLEDSREVAGRLIAILRDWPRARVLPAAHSLADALRTIRTGNVDILIADLDLPDGMGTTAIRELRARHPEAHAVVMTVLNDGPVVLEAIRAGATGYVVKDDETFGVIAAIDMVLEGRSPMSPAIARQIVTSLQNAPAAAAATPPAGTETDAAPLLTPREADVLKAIARGFSHREVAEILGISAQTVPVHARNIYRKLEATNKAEAVYVARQRGLLPQ
jgi:DNA-binding NarL/FixJ family response regulator